MNRKPNKNTAGFSLIEVLVAVSLLGLTFAMVFSFARVVTRSAAAGTSQVAALGEVQKAMTFMAQELQESSTRNPANYNVSPDGSALSFIKVQGYNVFVGELESTFSSTITYALQGDQLVRLEDLSDPADGSYDLPGERKVLANGVQSAQFGVSGDGRFTVTLVVHRGDSSRNMGSNVTESIVIRPQNDF